MLRITLFILLVTCGAAQSEVAPIPPPPAEQIPKFKLPPGFEIQLVVADPHIGQPMNLNFDARGMLWITHSIEYPFPARGEGVEPRSQKFAGVSDHAPRDRLTVVSGISPDGKPKNVEHFAAGLNIPVGQTPLGDGSRALVYGIPSIFLCEDKDGDGKAERRSTLYTRFGNIDVHGNASSFTRWIDGWVYGCHGFSNESEIRDGKGNLTRLRSGNTYRFREDGSRFEQFTWGQVNPFGLTFDPLGNVYSADCHSKPLYLLLRGASYPHFGARPPGLGFGPAMIDHNHGSTGVCGPAYYAATHFPKEYHDSVFICNPVTGRVHSDKLRQFGSTYQCDTQPDFITTNDKWFRPIDAIVGPDGALYIADFCNLIIGHYEAPLKHPDRDRTHGRVWRVVWRGEDGEASPPPVMPDLTKLSPRQLAQKLGDANLRVRVLATNYLVDRHGERAPAIVQRLLEGQPGAHARAHALWVIERTVGLEQPVLEEFARDPIALVRVHLMRMLAERSSWDREVSMVAERGLADEDAFVRRAAADAMGRHPNVRFVPALLDTWQGAAKRDTHLVHTVRLALSAHLRDRVVVAGLLIRRFDDDASKKLLTVASVTDGDAAAPLVLYHAKPGTVSPQVIQQAGRQIARFGTVEQLTRLIEQVPSWFDDDPDSELALLSNVVRGSQEKGDRPRENRHLAVWLERLAPQALDRLLLGSPGWQNRGVPGVSSSPAPWGVSHRDSIDRKRDAQFWDSIVGGESSTGILRSEVFQLPAEFSFWLCGHNGKPGSKEPEVNHVRLVHVRSGKVIARQAPPRNDAARRYTWKLDDDAGDEVRFEIVDAHRGGAYAWIAAGRFEPPVISVPSQAPGDSAARLLELVGEFKLVAIAPQLTKIISYSRQEDRMRVAAIKALDRLGRVQAASETLADMIANAGESSPVRAAAALAVGPIDSHSTRSALITMLTTSAGHLQCEAAVALTQTDSGTDHLLKTLESGKASGRLLQHPQVTANLRRRETGRFEERVAKLLGDLPPPGKEIADRMAHHLRAFPAAMTDPEKGKQLFIKNCAACHRIGRDGHMVGPQLDGIGNRGLERILEDILDPNRNVDVAFRTSTFITSAGKVITGLPQAREGEVIVVVDSQGKKARLPASEVKETRAGNLSLMPAGLGDAIKDQELYDLLAWLLLRKQT